MDFLGKHKVSFEGIRRLTIECYALSRSGAALLEDSEYEDNEGKTAALYEELISEKLLQLAIAIRTKFYQGTDHRRTSGFLENTGYFLKSVTGDDERQYPYTLKDICDKVIHASLVHLIHESDMDPVFIELVGTQTLSGQTQSWMLKLRLPEVCEGILGWLDAIAKD